MTLQLRAVLTGLMLTLPLASSAQAPSQLLPTSLGVVVFSAKGQTVQQQEKLDLFNKGFGTCLESKGHKVK